MVTVESDTVVALVAVSTLPAAALAALFVGPQAAAVIAIVGWLLLVPIIAILFEDEELSLFEGGDDAAEAEQPDPLETLRDRYARGELSDEAFEHQVERLLETENVEMSESTTRTTSSVDDDLDLERER